MQLVDDSELRMKMGVFAYDRVLNELSWDFEKEKLIKFYERILNN